MDDTTRVVFPTELVDVPDLDDRLAMGWTVTSPRVSLAHPHPDGRFYQHGWHSWSPARWVRLDAEPHWVAPRERRLQGWDPGMDHHDGHTSHWVGAVEGADGHALLLGALDLDAHVSASSGHLWGEAGHDVDWFMARGTPREVLTAYADQLAARLGSRRDNPGNTWCSWYSYGVEIDEARLHDVLCQLDGWPIDLFLVDDGWEQAVGDWHPNQRFPSGMADLSDRIRTNGRRAGLWLAPLIAHEASTLARRHPDWLVHDAAGTPVVAGHNWGGRYHGLDTTHPQVRDHLADLIKRVVHDWGWTYLKLDFLYGAAIPGWRHDDIGREAAYRSGVELIRDVAGDDVHLNACGAPIVPSIGVFDSLRIGPDVHPSWEDDFNASYIRDYAAPGTRHAVSTSVARLWLDQVIALDPDVAYFRTKYNLLRPEQRQILADLAHVTGFRATSDPPDWLSPDEAATMRHFFSHSPTVTRRGWHTFELDGRPVNFEPAALDHPRADTAGAPPGASS